MAAGEGPLLSVPSCRVVGPGDALRDRWKGSVNIPEVRLEVANMSIWSSCQQLRRIQDLQGRLPGEARTYATCHLCSGQADNNVEHRVIGLFPPSTPHTTGVRQGGIIRLPMIPGGKASSHKSMLVRTGARRYWLTPSAEIGIKIIRRDRRSPVPRLAGCTLAVSFLSHADGLESTTAR